MNATQMAALAPEHEDPNTGWYNRFARHPYYGELGKYFVHKNRGLRRNAQKKRTVHNENNKDIVQFNSTVE